MKIHLYGNNANMAFNFCRFLRRKNIDATVFVDKHPLSASDLPEWESSDKSGFGCVEYADVSVKGLLMFGGREREFLKKLKKCDLIHSFGEASMLAMFANRPYLHWTHGYDMDNIPFKAGSLKYFILSRLQRAALRRAGMVVYSMPHQRESAEKLGLRNARYFPLIPIDTDRYVKCAADEIRKIRSNYDCDLLFAHLARHEWVRNEPGQQNKGNDRLFRAFTRFVKDTDKKVLMLVAQKGRDLNESRQLISSLGIEKNIRWVPDQPKEGLIKLLSAVDIVFDQFNAGSAGLLVLESMSMGIPVFIHFGHEYEVFFDSLPPVANVFTEDDICAMMHELAQDPAKRRSLGAMAREWVVRHYGWETVTEKFIKLYEEILNDKKP